MEDIIWCELLKCHIKLCICHNLIIEIEIYITLIAPSVATRDELTVYNNLIYEVVGGGGSGTEIDHLMQIIQFLLAAP